MRKGEEVTERRHAVGTTGTSVGVGEGRELLQVVDTEDLGLDIRKGDTDGSTGGRNVLERSGSGEVEASSELLDESPRVEGVEEVDVAGRSRKDWGQLISRTREAYS